METILVSTLAVAIGEIGDKTQLLALILTLRFRQPLPIIAGILVATLANHGLAGLAGHWIRELLSPDMLRWVLGLSFIGVAIWALFPDRMDDDIEHRHAYGVFMVTLVMFCIAEIGDKTQVATVMLAARFPDLLSVICGTTLGMLIADVPAVLLGKAASPQLPLKAIRFLSAGIFLVLGVLALVSGVEF